jgi:hypothetical protein
MAILDGNEEEDAPCERVHGASPFRGLDKEERAYLELTRTKANFERTSERMRQEALRDPHDHRIRLEDMARHNMALNPHIHSEKLNGQ